MKYESLERWTFLGSLLLVSLAFLFLLKPFFGPIFWAVAIALIFHPVRQRLAGRIGDRPNLVALLTLMICMVIVIIPVMVLISSLVAEGLAVYQKIQDGDIRPGEYLDQVNQSFPAIEAFLSQFNLDFSAWSL